MALQLALFAVLLIVNELTAYRDVSNPKKQPSLTRFTSLGLLTRISPIYLVVKLGCEWRWTVMAGIQVFQVHEKPVLNYEYVWVSVDFSKSHIESINNRHPNIFFVKFVKEDLQSLKKKKNEETLITVFAVAVLARAGCSPAFRSLMMPC